MKFLCLHGMGTSAQIFEAQISQVVGQLVGRHEFVYIDGEIESGPIAGILHPIPLFPRMKGPY